MSEGADILIIAGLTTGGWFVVQLIVNARRGWKEDAGRDDKEKSA